MSQMIAEPKFKNRNQAYRRAICVRDALATLGIGGTAADVRCAVTDATGQPVSLNTIKDSLGLLFLLDVVHFTDDAHRVRWWKIGPSPKTNKKATA